MYAFMIFSLNGREWKMGRGPTMVVVCMYVYGQEPGNLARKGTLGMGSLPRFSSSKRPEVLDSSRA